MGIVAARLGERYERAQGDVQEPTQPDALAPPLMAHTVHAVVPVAGADQRQPVHTDREAAVERRGAVVEQRRRVCVDRSGWKYAST